MQPITKLIPPLGSALAARPDGLRRLAEGALIALLAVQSGRAVWLFLEPSPEAPPAVQAPPADISILTRVDPFAGGPLQTAPLSEDNGGYTLYGVSADGAGGGSAIIGQPDGTQVSVAVGESIGNGATLDSVEMNHVILDVGSRRLKVAFPDVSLIATDTAQAGEEGATVADTSNAEPSSVVDPQALMAEAGLRPAMNGVRLEGLSVTAKGDAPQLAAAGLQDGDIILSINGTALTSPQALNTLRQSLAAAPQAEISYKRDGQRRMTTVRTR